MIRTDYLVRLLHHGVSCRSSRRAERAISRKAASELLLAFLLPSDEAIGATEDAHNRPLYVLGAWSSEPGRQSGGSGPKHPGLALPLPAGFQTDPRTSAHVYRVASSVITTFNTPFTLYTL